MNRYYDLTVSLDDVRPPVWRRLLIAADATFADLHRAIQDACGWENYHLFEFALPDGERLAGLPDDDWDEVPVPDATVVSLATVLDEHEVLRYVYDFGDQWEHTVRREGVVESEEVFHRRLLDGARAFPREDCGGVHGYEECVRVARGGDDPSDIREWVGSWDPERFDLDAARRAFDSADRLAGPTSPFIRPGFLPPSALPAPAPPATTREELVAAAEQVVLLGRLGAFARWAGQGRKLTATGNLTRAAGAELIGLLGTDDQLDEQIGERVFKTRSTVELTEVDLAFRLARRAGFVKVRNGRVSATKRGERLGRDPLGDWHAAFDGLLALGVLHHRYAGSSWGTPYWQELVDGQVPGLLGHLLLAGEPVPLAELAERLWQLVTASFVLDDLDEDGLGRHRERLAWDVRHICRGVADLDALRITDVEVTTDQYGFEREDGGRAALTPLGVAAVHRLIQP